MSATSRVCAYFLVPRVAAVPLVVQAQATAAPSKIRTVSYTGTVEGGTDTNDGTFALGTKVKVTKQGKKLTPKRVTWVNLGRVYLYCDGVYVAAPVLDSPGAKVKKKKFHVDRVVEWNAQSFRVVVDGRFIGKQQKRASGTAAVSIPGTCGDAGTLTWKVSR